MSLFSLPLSERLECLEDLLSCCGQFNGWIYDEKGELIKTNSPHLMLHKIFVSSGCMDVLLKHAGEHREPLIMSIPYGLNWGAASGRALLVQCRREVCKTSSTSSRAPQLHD